MLLFNVCYFSAHKMLEKNALSQASIIKVVKDNALVKMTNGNTRRWSCEVGFKKFSEKPEYTVIYNYFKDHIAYILAEKGGNL